MYAMEENKDSHMKDTMVGQFLPLFSTSIGIGQGVLLTFTVIQTKL